MLVFRQETPAGLQSSHRRSGKDFSNITIAPQFEPGAFRVISYEMGILYAGMLKASIVLNKKKFDYAFRRLDLIAEICPRLKNSKIKSRYSSPVHSVLHLNLLMMPAPWLQH